MDFWMWAFVGFAVLGRWMLPVKGFSFANVSHISYLESYDVNDNPQPLMVPLTLVDGADSKGAGKFTFSLPSISFSQYVLLFLCSSLVVVCVF